MIVLDFRGCFLVVDTLKTTPCETTSDMTFMNRDYTTAVLMAIAVSLSTFDSALLFLENDFECFRGAEK